MGDIDAQTRQVLQNIEGVLRAAGASFADVVKYTIYLVGRQHAARVPRAPRGIGPQIYPDGRYPASTLVVVDQRASEEFLIEIEASAAV